MELVKVERHVSLAQDKFGQVEREPAGIIQLKDRFSADGTVVLLCCAIHDLLEQAQSRPQCLQERCFFLAYYVLYERLLFTEVRIGFSHHPDQGWHQPEDHGFRLFQKRVAVPHGTAQDTAYDITGFYV